MAGFELVYHMPASKLDRARHDVFDMQIPIRRQLSIFGL